MTRILVTGSRTWADARAVVEALDTVQARYRRRDRDPDRRPPTLVVGDCPDGADAIATRTWVKWFGMRAVEIHEARWKEHGNAAGYMRNTEMATSGVDLCVAFVEPCAKPDCPRGPQPHDSHGTAHCAAEARKAGVDVWEVRP